MGYHNMVNDLYDEWKMTHTKSHKYRFIIAHYGQQLYFRITVVVYTDLTNGEAMAVAVDNKQAQGKALSFQDNIKLGR